MSASRDPELDHLTEALRFELGKVIRPDIRDRVVNEILVHVDPILAADVGRAIGVEVRSMPSPRAAGTGRTPVSPALSMANTPHDSIATRKVAVLLTHGVRSADVAALQAGLEPPGGSSTSSRPPCRTSSVMTARSSCPGSAS